MVLVVLQSVWLLRGNPSDENVGYPIIVVDLHYEALRVPDDNNWSKEKIAYWFAQGLDVNAKTVKGITLLMIAAGNQNEATVQFLIDGGAYVNAQDDHGWTSLSFALMGYGYRNPAAERIIDVLLKHRADPCIKGCICPDSPPMGVKSYAKLIYASNPDDGIKVCRQSTCLG